MKKPSSEKLIMWGLLFAALAGLTVLFLHREYSLASVLSSIKTADPFWLLPGIMAMGLFFICEGSNIGRCLRLAGHRVSVAGQLKYSMAGFFFSSITPSASGGQPMQLYFMHKDGLPLSHSSLALLTELTSFQAAAAALALAGLVCQGSPVLAAGANAVTGASTGPGPDPVSAGFWGGAGGGGTVTLAILAAGVLISTAVLAVLLFTIFSPAAARIIASPVLWIIDKFNSQNASILRVRFLRGICEYRRASQYITKNPRAMAEIFLTSIIQLLAYFSITFCVCKSLGITGISWARTTLSQAALYVAVSALPLPGAVGVTEGGFAILFASLIPAELMGVAIILSRFVSFALPLVASGLGTFLLGSRHKRSDRHKKQLTF
ncbi:MAG: YbhN family protein [Anaerovoracaceae bacterium]